MSAPTGNFRGQRTQSSTSGYKTIGSSIASGNNSGSFKRIFVSALGSTNGNYDVAFTKSLGIPKNYYNSSSNSHYYQQPSLSGKTRNVVTDPNAKTLTQVYQQATVVDTNCITISNPTYLSTYPSLFIPSKLTGLYYGSLISQFTNINPNTYLIIQNTDVLQIEASDSSQNTYSFGNFIVVVNNGGQINLKLNNTTELGGPYDISPNCNSGNDGLTTCINTSNLSSYTDLINKIFPSGLYFNPTVCST